MFSSTVFPDPPLRGWRKIAAAIGAWCGLIAWVCLIVVAVIFLGGVVIEALRDLL